MKKFKIKYTFTSNETQEDETKKRSFSETVFKENIQQATEHAESYKNRVQDCSGYELNEVIEGGN